MSDTRSEHNTASHLSVVAPRDSASAVALVLHGGRATSTAPVRSRQLAVVRMAPFAGALAAAGKRHGLAVARLRYGVRGWNGLSRSPVADVTHAVDELTERFPDVPVALVGHSMGGRAAIYAAGHRSVTSVVALAPWIEPGDPVRQLRGRDLLVAHGTRDRTTSARASEAMVRGVQGLAASAAYVRVRHDGHSMLRRHALWHDLATGFVLAKLCGQLPTDTVRTEAANVLTQVLAGTTEIDV